MMPWLDLLPTFANYEAQVVRFWLTIANLFWLVPLAVRSIIWPADPRFPNASMAIPISGVFVGLAGFSAIAAFGFEPSNNWRAILSMWISANMVVLLLMGIARWRGFDL